MIHLCVAGLTHIYVRQTHIQLGNLAVEHCKCIVGLTHICVYICVYIWCVWQIHIQLGKLVCIYDTLVCRRAYPVQEVWRSCLCILPGLEMWELWRWPLKCIHSGKWLHIGIVLSPLVTIRMNICVYTLVWIYVCTHWYPTLSMTMCSHLPYEYMYEYTLVSYSLHWYIYSYELLTMYSYECMCSHLPYEYMYEYMCICAMCVCGTYIHTNCYSTKKHTPYLYVCMYVFIYMCVYIYMYICVYMYTWKYMYIYWYNEIFMCVYTSYMYVYIYIYTCTYMDHIYVCLNSAGGCEHWHFKGKSLPLKCIHRDICICIYMYAFFFVYAFICISYRYIYIHTYIYICIDIHIYV